MGRTAQRKGRAAEIELSALLNEAGYSSVRPGPCQSFGAVPDLTGLGGIHIECKNVKNLNILAALRQAEEDSTYFSGIPAVFSRHAGGRWVVSMGLESWLKIYQSFLSEQQRK